MNGPSGSVVLFLSQRASSSIVISVLPVPTSMRTACAIGGGGALLSFCQGSGFSTANRKPRTISCILSRAVAGLSAAVAEGGGAAGGLGLQPGSRGAFENFSAPVGLGGGPGISWQRRSAGAGRAVV